MSDHQIVLAALELVRQHSAEKLSMRQLAKKSAASPQLTQAQVRALVEWGLGALMDGLSAKLRAPKRAHGERLKRPRRASTRA